MRRLLALTAIAVLCLCGTGSPVRADGPDLRFLLAKLLESLDAGLSRTDLHSQRIEIGATIRLQVLAGTNPLANLAAYAKTLAAVDQAWAVLASAPACQVDKDKNALRSAADCRAAIEPLYRTLGAMPPDLAGAPNPGQWVQDLLKDLERQTDTALRAIQ